MKDSFVIYTKYEEQLNMLSDEQAGVLFRALMKYQSGTALPEMDDITALAFSFIKHQIDVDNQKYEDICKARSEAGKQGAEFGKLGGRPTKRAKTPKGDNETAKTAKGVLETPYGFSETAKTPESESDNDTDIYYTPLYPPVGEGEKGLKSAKERFLDTYPTVKANLRYFKGDDSNVDYEVLIDRFSKSKELQGKYSLTWIVANYEGIKSGFFDDKDKPKNEQVEAADARAARERWYQTNRANAELQAEYVHDRFMKNEEFRAIEKRLNVMESEIAKAELGADRGELKAKKELVKLTQEQGRLKRRRLAIIELNGMTEEALLPKWHCKKCSDTGYLPNGQACDCYSKR